MAQDLHSAKAAQPRHSRKKSTTHHLTFSKIMRHVDHTLQSVPPILCSALESRARYPLRNVAEDRKEVDQERSGCGSKAELFGCSVNQFNDGILAFLDVISMR